MLGDPERAEVARLYARTLKQDAEHLPEALRHRNLEPSSAEFISALAAGIGAKRLVEIGGSSGISTIALAAAARDTGGRLISIEIEPARQAESRETLGRLGLAGYIDYFCADAATVITHQGQLDFVLIDCEKYDYIRFFDMLRMLPGGIVVADNIISHNLAEYVAHVRSRPGVESITLPIGEGVEVTRLSSGQ